MELKEMLAAHRDAGPYPLHMPGHKRNTALFQLEDPYGLDITEICGFDDLHAPEGILKGGMERAARIYGSGEAWYLVNGSTAGILAGILSCTRPGDQVLVARNCHKSVYHALALNRLEPVWLTPEVVDGWGFSGSVDRKVVEGYLENTNISAVVVTSPTYEGVLSDVESIAQVCHKKSVPLLVDEAHGAHLGFGGFPESAVRAGADLVVQSLHKTLPAFTQTGLLHRQGDLVDGRRVKRFLDVFQSSSPSYILMAGIDHCLHLLEEGADFWESWKAGLDGFYRETADLRRIRVLGNPCAGAEAGRPAANYGRSVGSGGGGAAGIYARDPSKLVVSAAACGLRGPDLAELLREKYGFEVEMSSADYVIAMTGAGDRPEELLRFARALKEIDGAAESMPDFAGGAEKGSWGKSHGPLCFPAPETALPLWQAEELEGERCLLGEALTGGVSLEFVYAYPPGIPLLAPGERITAAVWEQMRKLQAAGILLRGPEEPGTLRVLKQDPPPESRRDGKKP